MRRPAVRERERERVHETETAVTSAIEVLVHEFACESISEVCVSVFVYTYNVWCVHAMYVSVYIRLRHQSDHQPYCGWSQLL